MPHYIGPNLINAPMHIREKLMHDLCDKFGIKLEEHRAEMEEMLRASDEWWAWEAQRKRKVMTET